MNLELRKVFLTVPASGLLYLYSGASGGERCGVRDDERGDHAEPDAGKVPGRQNHQKVSQIIMTWNGN